MPAKKNSFFNIFAGEKVIITTNIIIKDVTETQEGIRELEFPMQFNGYLLDEDSEYLYIGSDGASCNKAIKKPIVSIEIEELKSAYEEILENIEPPTEEEMN